MNSMRYNPKMTLMHEAGRRFVPAWSSMSIDEAFRSLESAKQFYQAWKEDVIRTVPKDLLLIFDVRSGWEPLTTFLRCPTPETPFPCVNQATDVQEEMNKMKRSYY